MLDELFKDIQNPEVTDTTASENPVVVSTTTIQETNTSSTVTDNQFFYDEYPMESWKPIETGKSPGLTEEAKQKKLGLYTVNKDFLFDLENNISKGDLNFVFTTFSALNKKPTIGGKEVELSTIGNFMKKPEFRKQLMEQALELESDPSLTSEVRFALMKSHSLNIIKNGELAHAREIEKKHMLTVAKWAGSNPEFNKKGWNINLFSKIIDENGNIRSEKDFKNLLIQKQKELLDKWLKENPAPKESPMYWARTDQSNPMQTHMFRDPVTKKFVQVDSRPSLSNSQEGWAITKSMKLQQFSNYVDNLKNDSDLYNKVKRDFIEAYNLENSPVTKLRTGFESRYGVSKGGEIQGTLGTIDFDLLKSSIAFKGKAILRPEVVELTNIIQLADAANTVDNEIKIAFGNKTGELPEGEISQNAKTVVKAILDDISNAPSRRKNATSKLPKGKITFSSIVAGGKPYYAYNIKFNNDYVNTTRFKGTEKNEGPAGPNNNPEFLTDGITIYVPKKIANGKMSDGTPASRLARDNKKASTVSPVEGLFTVSNDVQLRIPNGGQLNLTRTDDGETHVSGWNVVVNPNSGKMDTIHMPVQTVPFDRGTDLDWLVDDFYDKSFQFIKINDEILKNLNKDKKVFDPKILQHQY